MSSRDVLVRRLVNPSAIRIADLGKGPTLPVLPHNIVPVDAMIAPSLYIALHPSAQQYNKPTYVLPGSVDVNEFNMSRVLAMNRSLLVPPAYCGGAHQRHACAAAAADTGTVCSQSPGLVFGFLARLAPEKSIGLLLAAAAIVLKVLPETRFVVFGSGTQLYVHTVIELAARYGVQHAVSSAVVPVDAVTVFVALVIRFDSICS